MGAGITMAQGFSVAEPEKKCVAFVGDSTFFASGMTGIANAVYNQHDVTFVILDNATTAMTGSQPHPGTGVTLMGPHSKPLDIEGVLRALGVECIVHANPFCLDEALAAAQEALGFEGPSALIYEGPCVQLTKPAAPAVIDVQSCTGCKKCITSIGCPAIGFDVDGARPESEARASCGGRDAVHRMRLVHGSMPVRVHHGRSGVEIIDAARRRGFPSALVLSGRGRAYRKERCS